MGLLTQILVWLNQVANVMGKFLLAPIGWFPGWLSNALLSAVVGVLLLIVFKHTSNQEAIGRIRDALKAEMLTLRLFRDSLGITLQAQGRMFKGAFLLLYHSIPPLLVMVVPMLLLLSQMALWYQARPLRVGEETVVTLKLNGAPGAPWPSVTLTPTNAVDVVAGPVRVVSRREVCWKIRALRAGYHPLQFKVDGQPILKELAVGEDLMRVSIMRPGWHAWDVLQHPSEKPFRADSPIQSLAIAYPDRSSWISGTDSWVIAFFVMSMIFAFLFKPLLQVRI